MGRPTPYGEPVNRLLEIDDPEINTFLHTKPWPDYIERFGLSERDVPELIRLAGDKQLHRGQVGSHGEQACWAPAHAWRALGQMRAVEAVQPLIDTLEYCLKIDDDAAQQELPHVFAMIGRPAVDPAGRCLINARWSVYTRIGMSETLQKIAAQEPPVREQCVDYLVTALRKYRWNDPSLNGFLVQALCDLRAIETLPLVEEVHRHGEVDRRIYGGLDEARRIMGVEREDSAAREA